MGYENVSFYSNISLHNKFAPFYHRSWVCSGNIKVLYSINGAYRQSSHRRSSCSPFQTGAGISGSSLFSDERLYIPSSMHAIWSLSHRHIIPWAEVRKVIMSWNNRKQVKSEHAYLQWIMVLFDKQQTAFRLAESEDKRFSFWWFMYRALKCQKFLQTLFYNVISLVRV